MAALLAGYVALVFRAPHGTSLPAAAESIEHFYAKCAAWSALFTVLNVLVPIVCKRSLPSWYNSLTERKRAEMPAFVVCLVHHFLLVPVAWRLIFQDIWNPADHDYSVSVSWVAPISVGYLVGDSFGCAIPEALRGRFEYLIHHVLTLWLVWSTLFRPGQLLRYVPHLLICDSTNILFNVAWLLRTTYLRESRLVVALEVGFAALFLACRVVNLPLVFLAIWSHSLDKLIGWASITFLPISLLQWYWFVKIARTTVARLSGKVRQE